MIPRRRPIPRVRAKPEFSQHYETILGGAVLVSDSLELIDRVLEAVPTGFKPLLDGLTRAASETVQGRSPIAEHGLVGLVAVAVAVGVIE